MLQPSPCGRLPAILNTPSIRLRYLPGMARLAELLSRLGPVWQVRGRQWERICAWYLAHDPVYRSQVRRVWLWDEWQRRQSVPLIKTGH